MLEGICLYFGHSIFFMLGGLLISRGFLSIHDLLSVYYCSYEQALAELNRMPLDLISKELELFLRVYLPGIGGYLPPHGYTWDALVSELSRDSSPLGLFQQGIQGC